MSDAPTPHSVAGKARQGESSFSFAVTIGSEETLARVRANGLPDAQMGDTVDLGVLAYYHPNPVVRWWRRRKLPKRHALS